jgi:hypothetical protein
VISACSRTTIAAASVQPDAMSVSDDRRRKYYQVLASETMRLHRRAKRIEERAQIPGNCPFSKSAPGGRLSIPWQCSWLFDDR